MIKFVIFIFSVCLLQTPAFKLPSNKSERIIGGETTFAGEYPFLAVIYKKTSTGTYFCAGTLTSTRWVLTAGQCVVDAVLFTIRLGSNSLNQNDPNALTLVTEHYFLHPDFNPATFENDVGLIKLRETVHFTDYIRPINGITKNKLVPDSPVITAGSGQTGDDASGLADQLHKVSLVSLSNEECKITYGSQVADNMICVGGNYNAGVCTGDIGAPLIQTTPFQKFHVGIANFLSSRGCKNTDPSGFTRTGPYVDWILETQGNN